MMNRRQQQYANAAAVCVVVARECRNAHAVVRQRCTGRQCSACAKGGGWCRACGEVGRCKARRKQKASARNRTRPTLYKSRREQEGSAPARARKVGCGAACAWRYEGGGARRRQCCLGKRCAGGKGGKVGNAVVCAPARSCREGECVHLVRPACSGVGSSPQVSSAMSPASSRRSSSTRCCSVRVKARRVKG